LSQVGLARRQNRWNARGFAAFAAFAFIVRGCDRSVTRFKGASGMRPAPLGGQAVPVAVHGVDEPRAMRIGLDLLPETGNRMIDGAGVGHIEVAPHLSKQLVAVDDPLVPLDLDQRMRFSRTDWQSPQRAVIREGRRGGQRLVRPEGLEPPAYRFEACRSIQLSYGRSSSIPV
jgi:hypothetical protein